MPFRKKSSKYINSHHDVFSNLTNEMFSYWKNILFYNNILKKEELERMTSSQLVDHLSLLSYSKTKYMKYQIKLILKLFIFSLLCFFPRKIEMNRKLTLVYGLSDDQIFKSSTTTELLKFLQGPQVGVPFDNIIYVERASFLPHKIDHDKIKIVNNIVLYLYLNYLANSDRLNVLILILRRFSIYVYKFARIPHFSCVAVPYVIEEVLLSYIHRNSFLESNLLITTPSFIINSEYIFQLPRKFGKRTMIWYSANSIPIEYRDSSLSRATVDEQIYRLLPIDEHLVWTEDHRNYLQSLGLHDVNIKICGSLLFYLPKIAAKQDKVYDLMIFDVTPYGPNKISYMNIFPDSQNSIYNSLHAKKFLDDILWVKKTICLNQNIELRVGLKPKRNSTSTHDTKYTDYVDFLVRCKDLEMVPSETNLYEIVAHSKLCISYPFTSPAIIAEEFKIPSVYFLESDILKPNIALHGIKFIDSKTALLKFVENVLVKD